MEFRIVPTGDTAITMHFGSDITLETNDRIHTFTTLLNKQSYSWLIESVPAYTTITIYYDPLKLRGKSPSPFSYIKQTLEELSNQTIENVNRTRRTVEIPVCYGEEYGPDLEHVASTNGLTEEQVIDLHQKGEYRVYMLGFSPGFPYIGGLDERLTTPRKKTPAANIPEGAVGIAGKQTGIYPNESPGGWQIIGRTALTLFNPDNEQPTLLQAGDRVRFRSITEQEFNELKENKQ
jgi:inhibitor of KinA